MSNTTPETAAANKLGSRIKTYRERQELSQEELAERAGVATDFLAALEADDLYPSLGPLIKISRALGVRLGTFMDDHAGEDPCITRAADRGEAEELAMRADPHAQAHMRYHALGSCKTDRHMEPFHIEVYPQPGERELSSHEGEEHIMVLTGKITVLYGKDEFILEPGDSIYLNSVVPHWVGLAAGEEKASMHAVVYFPE